MKDNYLVLARKYRPSQFSDLKGQEFLVTTIVNSIKLNRIAHTFLLTGIRGSGKTTTARIIAKTLNCTSPIISDNMINPCGKCNNCQASFANKHPDIIELDAASRTGVSDAREIIENTSYLPILGKYKIFIIDEVHMLSNSAFNALLKTLEEPPEHVKFIFATTELRKIPITILSRCQKFDLKRLTVEQLSEHLADILKQEHTEADSDALQLIAAHSGGSVRDSLSLLDLAISNSDKNRIKKSNIKDILGHIDSHHTIHLLADIIEGNNLNTLKIIKELYYSGKDLINIFQQILELVHNITRIKLSAGINSFEYYEDELKKLDLISENCSIETLTIIWQMILKGIQEIQISTNQLITAEMLIIRLCHLSNLPTPSALMNKINKIESSNNSNKASNFIQQQAQHPKVAINSFEELVQLFYQQKEMLLYQYLLNDVSLIEFEPFKLKINHSKSVPHHFINKVSHLLQEWTGNKWYISVISQEGSPTLAAQADSAKLQKIQDLSDNTMIKDFLERFPEAGIKDIIKD